MWHAALLLATTVSAPAAQNPANETPAALSVVGVVVATTPQNSVAILRSGAQSRVVRLGENAFGARVTKVARDGVVLDFGDRQIEVRVRSAQKPLAASPRAAPAPATAQAEGSRSMAREEVQRRIAQETTRILSETAIAPVTADGQVRGFALNRLPAGANLLTDAGLRAGDVLTEINGVAIDSLPTLIGLWPRLQNERQLDAVVLRDGRPVTLSITLD